MFQASISGVVYPTIAISPKLGKRKGQLISSFQGSFCPLTISVNVLENGLDLL